MVGQTLSNESEMHEFGFPLVIARRPLWRQWRFQLAASLGLALLASLPGSADPQVELAYIGPGAGIALAGSVFAIFLAIIAAFFALLTLPIRFAWQTLRGNRTFANAKFKRVVVVGLDGLEPTLVEKFIDEGILPNLAKLREQGCYNRLGTTWPPLSPVAWSSFTTGTNPGKHNIFDFIDRSANYAPTMSSVRFDKRREGRKILGFLPNPFGGGTDIVGLRKSKPFWTVLGEAGIFSSVLRVPITFPPDKFNGVQLSAMCVPDVRGTLGMFTYYTETGESEDMSDGGEGGDKLVVQRSGSQVQSHIRGPAHPENPGEELRIPFTVDLAGDGGTLKLGGEETRLKVGQFTDFVPVQFKLGVTGKLSGVARFFLKRVQPFEMYCSPIQIDPEKPVMPISHPMVFSSYLAKTQGTFYTLGLAEDTGALDRDVLDEDAFLQHSYDIHAERERMFFDALKTTRRGAVVCVFDGSDRIQHMFWRFMDDQHPAVKDEAKRAQHREKIREMYQRMDKLVGRTMQAVGRDTALFVMSDHGFKTFRRGVDLNAWLRDEGYLHLKDDKHVAGASWLKDIDWERTQAFCLGLAGIFINQKGREGQGIVDKNQAPALVAEICGKLTGLCDPENGAVAIKEALPRETAYKGPYTSNAPDILVGYAEGYRVSWDAAVGKAEAEVFCDNLKAWSGDHCVHPSVAPGVLFSSIPLNPEREPNIIDMGPTILDLFGVATPKYMDGKSLCTS